MAQTRYNVTLVSDPIGDSLWSRLLYAAVRGIGENPILMDAGYSMNENDIHGALDHVGVMIGDDVHQANTNSQSKKLEDNIEPLNKRGKWSKNQPIGTTTKSKEEIREISKFEISPLF
jgi:hypothetical protein